MRSSKIGIFAATALALGLLVPAQATASSSCWNFKSAERGFTKKLNSVRSSHDLGAVELDPELSRVARVHTRAMVRGNRLVHSTTAQLTTRVTRWVSLAENIGVGGTVDSLHTAFMNSDTHRTNILGSMYNHVGVGTFQDGNRLWVTVIFEAETDPGTTLSMPRC
jgi:uncharacterized protein YkwD